MMKKSKAVLNPGSDEAIEAGCRCPVLDNCHGKGSSWGNNMFWFSSDCPLHRGISGSPKNLDTSCE